MPPQPSLQLHVFSEPRGARLRPSGRASQRGSEQSSPPKPGGQLHFPFALLHSANCWQAKSSRLQLKHGGHPSGRSSMMEKSDVSGVSMAEKFRYVLYAPAGDAATSAPSRVAVHDACRMVRWVGGEVGIAQQSSAVGKALPWRLVARTVDGGRRKERPNSVELRVGDALAVV